VRIWGINRCIDPKGKKRNVMEAEWEIDEKGQRQRCVTVRGSTLGIFDGREMRRKRRKETRGRRR